MIGTDSIASMNPAAMRGLSVPASRAPAISARSASTAAATSRPKRDRARRSDSRPCLLGTRTIIRRDAGAAQLRQSAAADAADAGLGEPDPRADLLERQAVLEAEDEDAPLERRDEAERGEDVLPARVARRPRDPRRVERAEGLLTAVDPLVERLQREWIAAALLAPSAARRAGERILLAECVEHLAADAPRGESGEARAPSLAVAACGLHEPDDAPGEKVLAVFRRTARRERATRDRARESEVRQDALVGARSQRHVPCRR